METKMDWVEKAVAEMFRGIEELKESQKKTDAQILELKESQKKTDEMLQRTDVQILELKESQKMTDEQMRRTDAKLERVGKQLADLGLVQGEVAEELFYRNLRSLFSRRKVHFEKISRNIKKKGRGEYDIVAVYGRQVLVVEVKNKLDKRMVDTFVEDRLPRFKELFPEYEGHQVVGGMGALVVKGDVERYAEKAGLYILSQTEEGGAALLNSESFTPRVFH